MTQKEIYKNHCEELGDKIPIYSQYWWMEAVCKGSEWDVIITRDKQGKISSTMPYLTGKKWGQKYIYMPPLTQTNGLHIIYPQNQNTHKRLEYEKEIVNEVTAELDKLGLSLFDQNFDNSFTNWLPFKWKGFRQTTRYTYRIPDLSNLEAVYEKFEKDRKRKIKHAEELGLVTKYDMSPETFREMHQQVLAKKGEENLVSKEIALNAMRTAIERGQGIIVSIHDSQTSQAYSAQFLMWDSNWTYTLICANDPEYSSTGASTYIMWQCMKFAQNNSKGFDFEGSVEEKLESFYNRFGSEQTAYHKIRKSYGIVSKIKDFIAELKE